MFIMQKAYQDNRAGGYIGMTVSYMMKGLSISRRTVQRSLTLLETRGYFRCEGRPVPHVHRLNRSLAHTVIREAPQRKMAQMPQKFRCVTDAPETDSFL